MEVTENSADELRVYKTEDVMEEVCKIELNHNGFSMYRASINSNGLKYYEHVMTESVSVSVDEWSTLVENTETGLLLLNDFTDEEVADLVDLILLRATEKYSEWKHGCSDNQLNEHVIATI